MKFASSLSIAALALAATATLAGPLTPPAGPVAPTGKMLTQVEPRTAVQTLPGNGDALYVISAPGSYYLTGDIVVTSGKRGIAIMTDEVTLDLNGFSIRGATDGTGTVGIFTDPTHSNISIRNGTLASLAGQGINAVDTRNVRIVDIQVRNVAGGVWVGPDSLVEKVQVRDSLVNGIVAGDRATIVGCVVSDCAATGIDTGRLASVSNSSAFSNDGVGIIVGESSTLNDCRSDSNQRGYVIGHAATVSNCTASRNTGHGFHAIANATFNHCASRNNGESGFASASTVVIHDSLATGNTGNGFQLANRSLVRGCNATNNLLNGFVLADGCTMDGCSASLNRGDGAEINSMNLVTNSLFTDNGLVSAAGDAGLRISGSANRVDNCMFNYNSFVGVRILAGATGNLVVRSSFTFNPARVETGGAGNNVAQMIVTPPMDFVSTDPWANFGH